MVVPREQSRHPPSKVTYLRLFQAVEPSPIFIFLVSVSSPNSPTESVGLLDIQSLLAPFLICILLMALCRRVGKKWSAQMVVWFLSFGGLVWFFGWCPLFPV